MKFNYKNRKQNLSKVIIDTGPLLLLITLNFVKNKSYKEKIKILSLVYDDLHKLTDPINNLNSFFENNKKITTTPHVIGELIGLANTRLLNRYNENVKNEFWDIAIEFLKYKNLEEQLIPLIHLYEDKKIQPLISKIGFVDSELIKLALDTNLPILSIDRRTLKNQAEKKLVEVLILTDDIYLFLN